MPYNPGVNSNAGTQAIISANEQSGATMRMLFDYFTKAGEQNKQMATDAKSAESFFKANPDALKSTGYDDVGFKNLHARDKVGLRDGYLKGLGAQETIEKIKHYGAQTKQMDKSIVDENTIGQFVQNYMAAPGPSNGDWAGEAPAPSPYGDIAGRMKWAADNTKGFSGRHLIGGIEALTKYGKMESGGETEAGGDPRITEGPFGTKLVSDSRGRGTPQVVRDEKATSKFTVEPIIDRFGRAAGYGVKAQFTSEDEAKSWAEQQNKMTGGGASVPASQYKSADEVTTALKAGTLNKEAALKILREQFGYK